MSLQPGDLAPDFTLRASDKSQVKLRDLRGRNVVLLFVPLAFTRVCTLELGMMRDRIAEFADLNADVLAISADSLYALDRWKREEGFNFPLLSDYNKTACKKYGVLYKEFVFDMKQVPKRAAFVVDPTGVIRYVEILDNAGELPNFEQVKKSLEALNHSAVI